MHVELELSTVRARSRCRRRPHSGSARPRAGSAVGRRAAPRLPGRRRARSRGRGADASASPTARCRVELALHDGAEADAALVQVARILSLDHDGQAFARLGAPAIRSLGAPAARPSRPAAVRLPPVRGGAWRSISARRPAAQAARIRAELGAQPGEPRSTSTDRVPRLPPARATCSSSGHGPGTQRRQGAAGLQGVAEAALAGELDVGAAARARSRARLADVQQLAGIGPFYAGLVVLRASGFADALRPMRRAQGGSLRRALLRAHEPPSADGVAELAEAGGPSGPGPRSLIRARRDARDDALGADRLASASARSASARSASTRL